MNHLANKFEFDRYTKYDRYKRYRLMLGQGWLNTVILQTVPEEMTRDR